MPSLHASFSEKIRKGNEEYRKGNYEGALDFFKGAEVINPDSPVVKYNLGNAYYKLDDYETAAAQYQRGLVTKDDKIKSKLYYNLGNTRYRLGKVDEAIDYYKETLRLNPDDDDARHNLQYLIKLKQDPQKMKQKQDEQKKEREKREQEKRDGDRKEKEREEERKKRDEKKMSKEDLERLLEMTRTEEKEAAKKKAKPVVPKLPATEKDW